MKDYETATRFMGNELFQSMKEEASRKKIKKIL
jgi:hypothetical protein